MPTYNDNILFTTTGLDVGSPSASPDIFARNLTVSGTISQPSNIYNVRAYGATGDGITDDTAAIQAALSAATSGGTVFLPQGTYKTTSTLVPLSNTVVAGAGAGTIIKFVASAPFVGGVNDRAFHTSSQLSSRRQMAAGAIAVGATTFTANSAADTADLVQGDWVLIAETDSGAGDIVIIDWVQVKSVSTVTVTVQSPFRKAFPNSRAYSSTSGLAFIRVTSLKENITFRDFRINQPASSQTNPSLSIGAVRNTLISNVIIDNASGQSFYAYKAQGLKIIHSTQLGANQSTSEIGACVDVSLLGNNFGEIGTSQDSYAQANTSALSIDLGTAFFSVIGNLFTNGGNVMMTMYYGVSDGVVSGNVFSYTRDGGIGSGSGLAALGAQRVTISNNTLNGGTSGGTGILVQDTGTLNVNITSSGNVISFNNISNFTNRFGTQSTSDVYFNPNTSAPNTEITGGLNINNSSFGLIARQTSSTGFTSLRVQNDINSSVRSLEMDYSGSAYASPIVTGAPSGEAGAIYTTGAFPLVLGANGNARIVVLSGGNVGIGNSTPGTALDVTGAIKGTQFIAPRNNVAVVNGANADVAIGSSTFIKLTGPTGVFSISGFTGGADGRVLTVYNSVAFAWTITNNATSTAANRILTLTGGDVVLRAGQSAASFRYDSVQSLWILISQNG